MRRLATALALALAAAMLWSAPAAGHGFYVDDDAPPGGDCQSIPTACRTLTDALTLVDPDPEEADFIVVAPGTYTENVVLDNPAGRSLLASSTSSPGSYVIEPANPADPTVEIAGPSDIVGFTIGGQRPVVIGGPGRVLLSSFSSSSVPDGEPHVLLRPGADAGAVEQSAFADDGTGAQVGVEIGPGVSGSPLVRANDFSGLWHGVEVLAGAPRIENNVIAGPSPPSSAGIVVDGAAAAKISGDLIFGRETGLAAGGDVTATNVTAFDNTTADIALSGSALLTLSSSVVESPIASSGLGDCAISYSAGPVPPPAPSACESFQTSSANPGFADPAAGDYDLIAGSPLIDAGDPAVPPAGAVDLDGEQRAVAGTCGGAAVRDIGADELVPNECPVDPPPVPPVDPPPPGLPPAAVPPVDRPDTAIDKTRVEGRSVTFRFSSDGPDRAFLCRLDRRPYRGCESPVRYRGLDPGRHVFRVKAVDIASNEDPEPARKRFRIESQSRAA
jgi:hypothetical protein